MCKNGSTGQEKPLYVNQIFSKFKKLFRDNFLASKQNYSLGIMAIKAIYTVIFFECLTF
jgi:hypothetical protein